MIFQLVQIFKTIRAKATTVLQEMSTELLKIGEREGTAESRKAFVEACQPVMAFAGVSLHFNTV
jgi:N-terminal acetyltransferase B complex non-catalytic subunit